MKQFLIALLILTVVYAFAQVPGYQGKRFYVKYNLGFNHPGMFGRPGKLPALLHHGSMEYVVSRHWAIGANYDFMFYKASAPVDLFKNSAFSKFDRSAHKGLYQQHVASLYLKYFLRKRGFIAPVGPYVIGGLFYQYSKNRFYSPGPGANSGEEVDRSLQINNATAHYGGIQIGMGRTFIVANRLIIDLGFTGNITLPPPDIFGYEYRTSPMRVAYADLVLRNLFQFHIGIGVLAF